MIRTFWVLFLVFSLPLVWGREKPLCLEGGVVYTCSRSGKVYPKGWVLFHKGRILGVGEGEHSHPPRCQVVSVKGYSVFPGLVSANTVLGLVEVPAVRRTVDIRERGDFTPEVWAGAAYHPASRVIGVTRANGVLYALVVPRGGVVAGRSTLVRLSGWTVEEVILRSEVGLHIFWPSLQDEKRDLKIKKLQRIFSRSKAFFSSSRGRKEKGGVSPRTSLRLFLLGRFLRQKKKVFFHVSGREEILEVLGFARRFQLSPVLVGGEGIRENLEVIRKEGIPVILAGIHRTPWKRDTSYKALFTLPQLLHKAGVPFAIATTGGSFMNANERNLPYHAAAAAAYGLPREIGLLAITRYPAEILGVAEEIGSLERGKRASLFVATGHILESTTRVIRVYIEGKEVPLENYQSRLYEKYRKRYFR